ncbi:MAG: MotA/TolQ/ExbB proton channel family protein [Rubripirellula sp.]|nr:MotA/TolQ/ExbB proton channel family protein [Rubripirellula sp.]
MVFYLRCYSACVASRISRFLLTRILFRRMSYFKVPCPGCSKPLKVPENLAGKSRACPYCRATVRIPDSASTETENSFPNIKISEAPGKAKRSPPTATKSAKADAPVAPQVKPKQQVKRKRRQKSWFSSNSDSASSDVSLLLSGLMGGGMTIVWYGVTFPIRSNYFGALFWERGPVPIPTTFLMFWATSILILKWLRLRQQREAMLLDVLPIEISNEITVDSLDDFIAHINELPGASSDSFLINRVVRGIEHFRVRKSAAETVTMMESQSAIDANNVAGSYTILKVFIWSLPILGFIGTVMGVSSAVASLANSLSDGGSMDAMKAALQDVFGGLGTAFDTTLLALIMSMLVKIPASALQKNEEDLITSVDEYCNEILLRRLNDGRDGGAQRGAMGGNGDTAVFREAVEQALGTQHAEMERWLQKLDAIGEHLTEQVSKGWDDVNDRIEAQQQKHVATLYKQELDQQARLQAQLDQMANAASKIQSSLSQLSTQTEALQSRVNTTFSQTGETLENHLTGVESGLTSLGNVLTQLSEHQVVIQQVQQEPTKGGWFGKSKRQSNRNRKR